MPLSILRGGTLACLCLACGPEKLQLRLGDRRGDRHRNRRSNVGCSNLCSDRKRWYHGTVERWHRRDHLDGRAVHRLADRRRDHRWKGILRLIPCVVLVPEDPKSFHGQDQTRSTRVQPKLPTSTSRISSRGPWKGVGCQRPIAKTLPGPADTCHSSPEPACAKQMRHSSGRRSCSARELLLRTRGGVGPARDLAPGQRRCCSTCIGSA